MDLINISTNWLCDKSIKSCIFVRDLEPGISSDSDKEDIELLLENYENCVKLNKPDDNKEESLSCKIIINTKHENTSNESENRVKVHSFSILCSAKAIEIHGNHNEYVITLSNELIDETDGLFMFRNDYQFNEPQEEIYLTFKGFQNDLWIYALLLNIKKVKQTIIQSNSGSNIASIINLMSMFGKSMKGISSDTNSGQQENSSQLMSSKGSHHSVKKDLSNDEKNSSKSDSKFSSEQSTDHSKCSTDSESQIISVTDNVCQCECHNKCGSDQKSVEFKELREYIDQKFSCLETSIDNKFMSLENKMFAFLNLNFNK